MEWKGKKRKSFLYQSAIQKKKEIQKILEIFATVRLTCEVKINSTKG